MIIDSLLVMVAQGTGRGGHLRTPRALAPRISAWGRRAMALREPRGPSRSGATAPELNHTHLIGLPSLWTIVPSRPHTLSLLHPISDHPPHAQPPVEYLTERPCRCARPLLTLLTSPPLFGSDLSSLHWQAGGDGGMPSGSARDPCAPRARRPLAPQVHPRLPARPSPSL